MAVTNFDIKDDPTLTNALVDINARFPVVTIIETQFPNDGAPGWERSIELSSTGLSTRVRAQPHTTAAIVGTILRRTPVHINEQAAIREGGLRWFPIILLPMNVKGWVREDVVRRDERPIVLRPVPYVSQTDLNANLINNDCPEAAALMLIQYERVRAGKRVMRGLTVDMLVTRGELKPRPDTVKDLEFVVSVLDEFGVAAARESNLTLQRITELIDADRPPILLVNYEHLKPGKRFGHYVTAIGYGENGVWIHDPYLLGQSVYVTEAQLERALTDIAGIALRGYQGVVLA